MPVADPPGEDDEHLVRPNSNESNNALEAIAEIESAFTERFYELFFEARPDVRPLFGAHSLSEQEEMMRETLRSLLALEASPSWLNENLRMLGKSHAEYGVTPDMYASFVDVMVACANELLGDAHTPAAETAFARDLHKISSLMLEGTEVPVHPQAHPTPTIDASTI